MRHLFAPALATCLCLASPWGRAGEITEKPPIAIAVIDFGYVDTSGEVRDQHREHEARLAAFMRDLRRDLGQSSHFRLVTRHAAGLLLHRRLGTGRSGDGGPRGRRRSCCGGVHKMSTLVQNAKSGDRRRRRVVLTALHLSGHTDEAGAGPKPSSLTTSRRFCPVSPASVDGDAPMKIAISFSVACASPSQWRERPPGLADHQDRGIRFELEDASAGANRGRCRRRPCAAGSGHRRGRRSSQVPALCSGRRLRDGEAVKSRAFGPARLRGRHRAKLAPINPLSEW